MKKIIYLASSPTEPKLATCTTIISVTEIWSTCTKLSYLAFVFPKTLFTFLFVGLAVAPSGFSIGTLTKGRSIDSGKPMFSEIVGQIRKYKYVDK